jgi:magnesium transporter
MTLVRDGAWITAVAPDAAELAELQGMGFDRELLSHALDPHERPRARTIGGATFTVLRAPLHDPSAPVPYTTTPIAFIVNGQHGLTLARRDSPVVRELAAHTGPQHHMVFQALGVIAEAFLDDIGEIRTIVDELEQRLGRSLENREVLELLRYQKSLVDFCAALEAMHMTVERMRNMPAFRVLHEDEEWMEDVLVELRQALETANVFRDVMSEMMDAFASIISNNLNVVMKFLAAVTVILTFPMLVASYYGMNVELPWQRSTHAFAMTMAVSLLLSVAVALLFRQRRWL